MAFGCPKGHTEYITQACTLTIHLPVIAETGETKQTPWTAEKTDNWEHGHYYCSICRENLDHLVENPTPRITTMNADREFARAEARNKAGNSYRAVSWRQLTTGSTV